MRNGSQIHQAAQHSGNARLDGDGGAGRFAGLLGNPPESSGDPPVPDWAPSAREPRVDPAVLAELHALDEGAARGFFEAIVGDFREAMREQLETASRALRAADGATLAAASHKMRGSCGVLGARRLAWICERLESAAREGRLRDELPLLAAAEAEYRRVQRAMDAEAASRPANRGWQAVPA